MSTWCQRLSIFAPVFALFLLAGCDDRKPDLGRPGQGTIAPDRAGNQGGHLKGADDTEAKRKLFELLEAAYAQVHEAGEVELFAEKADGMQFKMLMQPNTGDTAWKSELAKTLDD